MFHVPGFVDALKRQIVTTMSNNKQLLDEVFAISRIIKVEVTVISLNLRLRLITVTSTLIIRDIAKTSSNNCLLSYNALFCEQPEILSSSDI